MPPSLPHLSPAASPRASIPARPALAPQAPGPGRPAPPAMGGTQQQQQLADSSAQQGGGSANEPGSRAVGGAGAGASSSRPAPALTPSPSPGQPPSLVDMSALALMAKCERLEDELRTVERELYDLETAYLQDANQTGSVLRGFDALLAARVNVTSLKRPRKFQAEDRVFSLSSATSLAAEEGSAVRDTDGRYDGSGTIHLPGGGTVPGSQSRARQTTSTYSSATAAGTPSSGPGKQNSQKRSRSSIPPREGKKLRQQIEQEDSDDEDSQTSSLA